MAGRYLMSHKYHLVLYFWCQAFWEKRSCSSVVYDAHAIGIQKMNHDWSVAYQAAGVGQIWHKKNNCPPLEDVSCSRLQLNVARKWCPLLVIGVTCHAADIGQMWQKRKIALRWRTLSHCVLWSNVVQIVPLVGGLCHAADFDQMWSKMHPYFKDFVSRQTSTKCGPKLCPSLEEFVSLQTSTRCGLNMCPLLEDFVTLRTLTKCGPNMSPSTQDFIFAT